MENKNQPINKQKTHVNWTINYRMIFGQKNSEEKSLKLLIIEWKKYNIIIKRYGKQLC